MNNYCILSNEGNLKFEDVVIFFPNEEEDFFLANLKDGKIYQLPRQFANIAKVLDNGSYSVLDKSCDFISQIRQKGVTVLGICD